MKHGPIVDQSIEFDATELFFSITNPRGVIQSCNDTFVHISGYAKEELVGKPHSIVRHPDMPKAVFKLFWDKINSGQPVSAFVKNLAKDGRYYWVLATVLPIPEGHLSVRLKCSGRMFEAIQPVYKEMLEIEGLRGMEAAGTMFGRRIQTLGFANYDEFMAAALLEELHLAAPAFKNEERVTLRALESDSLSASLLHLLESSHRIESHFETIFRLASYFKKLEGDLRNKTVFITTLARELNYLSARVGDKAQKIADEATDASDGMHRQILAINNRSKRILEITKQAEYQIGVSSLQIKMLARFVKLASALSPDQLAGDQGRDIKAHARILSATMASCIRRALSLIGSLPEALMEMDKDVDAFARSVGALRKIRSYRDDAALLQNGDSLEQESHDLDELFKEMETAIRGLEPEIIDFQRFRDSIRDSLSVAGLAGITVCSLLDQQSDLITSLAA